MNKKVILGKPINTDYKKIILKTETVRNKSKETNCGKRLKK